MRKTIAAVTAAAALLLISAPVAAADDPIQIASFGVTPATVDLTGADQQVDFAVVTSAGTNTVTGVSVDLAGIGAVLTSGDSTNWAGSLSVPSTFKAGTYQAVVTAVGGGGQQATDSKSVVVRTQPVITLTRTPTTPKAGGNYLVSGSIKEPNGAGVLVGMAATLTLTGPGYSSTFAVGSTGAFHHAVTHALPATWTASYAGNTTHLASSGSTSLTVSANATRFVGFNAGPEPAYLFGAETFVGYLQRLSPTTGQWIAYGGQRVTISRTTPGPYATHTTTTSTGHFSLTIHGQGVIGPATWHASFAGWSSGSTVVNAASVSSGDAVATVAPPLRITRVYYDVPGSDTPITNTKLNQEYVIITNEGHLTFDLYRYVLRRDPAGYAYEFGTHLLAPGQSVVVHTGQGTNAGAHVYMGLGNYVWDNTGGTAVLQAYVTNQTVDSCTWGNGIGYTNC